MEQNILKRYNEIHTMLWEEVLKVFASRTNKIRGIEYYRTNKEQIETLYPQQLKRTAIFNLFVRGKITEEEKNNLLESANCAACYIAYGEYDLQFKLGTISVFEKVCKCCPIEKWREMDQHCKDYNKLGDKICSLINYIVKCINGKEKFNLGAYMSLRKDIMKKMYIVAHLEWGYEQNEV